MQQLPKKKQSSKVPNKKYECDNMPYNEILTKKTWYESLDFEKNPFSMKPNHTFSLRGQEKVSEQVISLIKDEGMCIVHGTYGTGKTSFLHKIITTFKGDKKVAYFSCNRLTKELDIKKLLTERTLISKLFNIKGKQMILLLDEADSLSKSDFTKILSHYKKGFVKSVVFITHNFEKFEVPKEIMEIVDKNIFTFERLDEETVIQIVHDRVGENKLLPDDVVKEIYAKSRSMRHFLKNCEIFMRHMVEKKRKKASKKDVTFILRKHAV